MQLASAPAFRAVSRHPDFWGVRITGSLWDDGTWHVSHWSPDGAREHLVFTTREEAIEYARNKYPMTRVIGHGRMP